MQPTDLVLTPETRLVLATAGGPSSPALAFASAEGLRWDAVVQVALHERGITGLSAVLQEHSDFKVPAEVIATLKRMSLASRLRMTWLAYRLDETVRAFGKAGIPVMLLKGAALGNTAYRSLAERQMGDLDLLVPVDMAADARRVALESGWRTTERELEQAFYRGHHHLPPLSDQRAPDLHLEIHTDLLPKGNPFALAANRVWRDAQYVPTVGALVPSTVDQALHVAVHLAWGHMMSQGAWQAFRDFRQIAGQADFNWSAVVDCARHAGATSALYWTLELASAAGGVPVPPHVMVSLRPPRSGPVLAALGRHLGMLMDPLAEPCPSFKLSQRLWISAMRDDVSKPGVAMPWSRDPLNFRVLPRPGRRPRPWLVRHLGSLAQYPLYLGMLALGRSQGTEQGFDGSQGRRA